MCRYHTLYIPSVKAAGLRAICQGTSHAALVAPRHFRTAAWAKKMKLQAAWNLWIALKSRLIKSQVSPNMRESLLPTQFEPKLLRIPFDVRLFHVPEGRIICSNQKHLLLPDPPELRILILSGQKNEKLTWCGTTLWHSFLKPWGKQNGLFLNQGDKPIWMLNLPMANPGSTMSPPNEPANGHVNQVQLSCYHFFESCMHQQVVSQVLSKSLPEHFSELISSRWGYAGGVWAWMCWMDAWNTRSHLKYS